MNAFKRLGKWLNSRPAERSATSVARAMRKSAVCAGLVIGVAGCANGSPGGSIYSGGVYAGSGYDRYSYDDRYAFGYGTPFYHRNPLYDPFYDDDDDWRDQQHKKWWNSLSDEEKARVKARWKDRESEEREEIRERAHARERSEDTEQFWRLGRARDDATMDGTDDLPLDAGRSINPRAPVHDRHSGAGGSQEQPDDSDADIYVREHEPGMR
jgi:hypothetical protein